MTTLMMLVFAGPNGAGKSTLVNGILKILGQDTVTKLNADDRTRELQEIYPDRPLPELNLMAAQQIDAEVAANIRDKKSFYVETVLSSDKYRDDVLKAKSLGYKFNLVYVSLFPAKLSPERVATRVKKGGHAVDPLKAISRYARSHRQLRWFAEQADLMLIYDNSGDNKPILLASKLAKQEIVHHKKGVNPLVDRIVSNMIQKKTCTAVPKNG